MGTVSHRALCRLVPDLLHEESPLVQHPRVVVVRVPHQMPVHSNPFARAGVIIDASTVVVVTIAEIRKS